MAPSLIERVLSGTSKSSLIAVLKPKPLHSGHAPNGALKENILGSKSGNE